MNGRPTMRNHARRIATLTLTAALAIGAPAGAWAVDGDVADQAAAAAAKATSVVTAPGQSVTLAGGTYWTSLTDISGIAPGQYRVKLDGNEGTQVVAVTHLDEGESSKDTTRELVAGETVTIDVDANSKVALRYPVSTTWTLVKAYDNYGLLDAGALVPRAGAKTYRVGNTGILSGTYEINLDGAQTTGSQHVAILDVDRNIIDETTVSTGAQVVEVPEDATYIRLDTTTPTVWRKLEQQAAWKRVKDVDDTTAHHEEIMDLMKANVSTGWEQADGSVLFGGMQSVVRQDMAAFLYRLAGSPDFDTTTFRNPFTDVNEDTPHYKEIIWLYANDIAKGYEDADGNLTFGGMRPVVRQDMAAFLKRYAAFLAGDDAADADDSSAGVAGASGAVAGTGASAKGNTASATGASGDSKSFTDVNAKTPHADDIAWLSQAGIADGYADGSFGGMRTVVRQDMAAFLIRLRSFTN